MGREGEYVHVQPTFKKKWFDNCFVYMNCTRSDRKVESNFFPFINYVSCTQKMKKRRCERRLEWNTINNINADISQIRIKQTIKQAVMSVQSTVRHCCYCRQRCCRRRRRWLFKFHVIDTVDSTECECITIESVRMCDIDAPTVFADVANARWSIKQTSGRALYLCYMCMVYT